MKPRAGAGADGPTKRYDRAYFDRWYRRAGIGRPSEVARAARYVLATAEHLLERPVRSVLDVGCGEAPWRAPLLAQRPSLRYVGVDPSEYVVRRFGKRRGIRLGTFGSLDEAGLDGTYELVVCCGVVNYLPRAELTRGLEVIAALLGGVAFIEVWTTADDVVGDRRGWQEHSPAYYRRIFQQAGLIACGMHCYVGPALADEPAALERGAGGG